MSTQPQILCWWDRCHSFSPGSHNSRYCPECRCKRKAENARKRLTVPLPDDPRELWQLQENRKLSRMDQAQLKNEWLLDNARIGVFDIETTQLDASIGMLICACIKDRGGETVTFVADRNDDDIFDDHAAVVAIRDYLEQLDYVVTYYGTRFDVPFLNTRLIVHNERPIDRLRHIDLYYVARFRLKLHSNRLQVVAETLFGDSQKTRVLGNTWVRAVGGDEEALGYITEHCRVDVDELLEAFEQLRGFVNLSATRWRKYGASY